MTRKVSVGTNCKTRDASHLVHEILVLDAFLAAPLDVRRYRSITRDLISDLLNELGMEPLGQLGIYPAVDLRQPGWSFIQPITTSHVSAHYFENPGDRAHIRIDAYSCAAIDWAGLIAVCHAHLQFDEWFACFIDRQLDKPQQRRVFELAGNGKTVASKMSLSRQAFEVNGGTNEQ